MPISDFAQRLATVAVGEHQSFSGFTETDPLLRRRIYDTYLKDLKAADPSDPLGWNMSTDITSWAWSATFVSWCVLQAGATKAQFDFSIRHAMFIKATIANQDNHRGVFRARKIGDHAPQLGDIISSNRSNGTKTYDEARTLESYNAHTAIVVDFVVQNGVRFAVTIGGNESDSIRRTKVRLTSQGLVKQRASDPYICVIQILPAIDGAVNLPILAAEAVEVAEAAMAPPTPLPPAFSRHGTFVYDPIATTAAYGSPANVAAAARAAGMSHAWLRAHGVNAPTKATRKANLALVEAFASQNIACAAWGWCQGADAVAEAKLAIAETKALGLTDYVADIEPEHNNAHWTITEIQKLCSTLRAGVPGGLGVSSFALVDWHEPHLYAAAIPYIDMFAPQIYWFNYPNSQMHKQFTRPNGGKYDLHSPAAYVDLCLDRWVRMMGNTQKPLIVTGQAYWGEGISQPDAEAKLNAFLADWSDYGRIHALNWWHFGASTGMSHGMLTAITSARLDTKAYHP